MTNLEHLQYEIKLLELHGLIPYPGSMEQEFDWLETKFNRWTPQQDAEPEKQNKLTEVL